MQPADRRVLISERLVNGFERSRLWWLLFTVIERSDHYRRIYVAVGESYQNEIADFGQHGKAQTTDSHGRPLKLNAAGSQTNVHLMIVLTAVSGKHLGDESQLVEPIAGQLFADDCSQHGDGIAHKDGP